MIDHKDRMASLACRQAGIANTVRLPRLGTVRLGVRDAGGNPHEREHFIIDAESVEIRKKAIEVYGPKPTEIGISFLSDNIDDVFRCTYQRWATSPKGMSFLLCEGNGVSAKEQGQGRACPCRYLGTECRKKSILRFLIPKVSMSGYFLLVTKSENNAAYIQTAVRRADDAPGGLSRRPMKLIRSEGYAMVRGMKMRKYYVHLISAGSDEMQGEPHARRSAQRGETIPDAVCAHHSELQKTLEAIRRGNRIEDGRKKVKEKVRLYIRDPRAIKAVEAYACARFSKPFFEALTLEDLTELWHDLDKRDVIGSVLKDYAKW